MLAELTDHVMDIAMNSVRAGASTVKISIVVKKERNLLAMIIGDDGVGMTEDVVRVAADPFFSTKNEKKVGLGIPLLQGATQECGGEFFLESTPGVGTIIRATFALDHPDLPPLGNIKETILLLCVTNPQVRFVFRYRENGKNFTFDTREIHEALEEVPMNHPEVIRFLERYLDERL